jgi:hypothetical protein
MFDFIAEFLFDAVGGLFENGADAAAGAATDIGLAAATDVGADALSTGVEATIDPGAALAPTVDAAAGGSAPFEFDNHPVSATLRQAGFSGQV